MDEDTIEAEEEIQVLQVENLTREALKEAVQLEQELMELRQKSLE